MATNVNASTSVPNLELPRAGEKVQSVGWETIALVVGIVMVSVALLYLPYVFSAY
ncbi:MAG: hypothetical protein Q7T04_04765 [Dehalococcoidia bacterium]|nr:hypothetical protein [Dehalococcoidia bacterium]